MRHILYCLAPTKETIIVGQGNYIGWLACWLAHPEMVMHYHCTYDFTNILVQLAGTTIILLSGVLKQNLIMNNITILNHVSVITWPSSTMFA